MSILKKIFKGKAAKRATRLQKYLTIDGWLTPAEANGLFEIAGLLPARAIAVEIGSWKGKSTYCIATGLRSGTINCIDPFNAAGDEGNKEIYEKQKGVKNLLDQFKDNLADSSCCYKNKTV